MSSNNNDYKVLIDTIKYTSDIILEITNKLTFLEDKMNNLERNTSMLKNNQLHNLNHISKEELNTKKILSKKNTKDKNNYITTENTLSNYLVKNDDYSLNYENTKDKSRTSIKSTKLGQKYESKTNNITNDKSKIDKLIGSIIKRKNDLSEKLQKKEEYDIKDEVIVEEYEEEDKQDKIILEEDKQEKEDKEDKQEKKEDNNLNNIKQIRRKINFARRF